VHRDLNDLKKSGAAGEEHQTLVRSHMNARKDHRHHLSPCLSAAAPRAVKPAALSGSVTAACPCWCCRHSTVPLAAAASSSQLDFGVPLESAHANTRRAARPAAALTAAASAATEQGAVQAGVAPLTPPACTQSCGQSECPRLAVQQQLRCMLIRAAAGRGSDTMDAQRLLRGPYSCHVGRG
jgi:hypothetical protein